MLRLSPTAIDAAASPLKFKNAQDAKIAVLCGENLRILSHILLIFLSFFLAQITALQHQLAAQETAAGSSTATAEDALVVRLSNVGNLQEAMQVEDPYKYHSFCVSLLFLLCHYVYGYFIMFTVL